MFADTGSYGDSKRCPSPSDYGPWGLWGMNQYGELAVVEQAQRAEQPTAHRDIFPCELAVTAFFQSGREADVSIGPDKKEKHPPYPPIEGSEGCGGNEG